MKINIFILALREQVEPLLLGHRLLTKQLQDNWPHQIPFVLELEGPFVLGVKWTHDLGL